MEAGLPVIASDFALWREIIDKSGCGVCVDPTKPEKISEAIKYLSENPERARKMGSNGRKAVLKEYNWDNESKKFISIYDGLSL